MARRAVWCAVVTGCVLAGCSGRGAGASGPDAVTVNSVGSLSPEGLGQRCMFASEVEETPQFDDLVRMGTRGSVALWGRGADEADTVELSVRYDGEGRLAWVQPLHSTMAAVRAEELARLVTSSIEEEGRADWGVRIRTVAGVVDRVIPSVICRPERTSLGTLSGQTAGVGREWLELGPSNGRPHPVEVSLDEQGRVVDVRLPYSTGYRILDQYLIDIARLSDYAPKLHDGIGIPSVLETTLRYPRAI